MCIKTLAVHKLACSCFVALLWSSVEQASSKVTLHPSQPPPHTTISPTPTGDPIPPNKTQLIHRQHHPYQHNKANPKAIPSLQTLPATPTNATALQALTTKVTPPVNLLPSQPTYPQQ